MRCGLPLTRVPRQPSGSLQAAWKAKVGHANDLNRALNGISFLNEYVHCSSLPEPMLCPIRPLLLLRLLLWCFAWLRGFLLPPNRFLPLMTDAQHGFETTELIRFEISRIAGPELR